MLPVPLPYEVPTWSPECASDQRTQAVAALIGHDAAALLADKRVLGLAGDAPSFRVVLDRIARADEGLRRAGLTWAEAARSAPEDPEAAAAYFDALAEPSRTGEPSGAIEKAFPALLGRPDEAEGRAPRTREGEVLQAAYLRLHEDGSRLAAGPGDGRSPDTIGEDLALVADRLSPEMLAAGRAIIAEAGRREEAGRLRDAYLRLREDGLRLIEDPQGFGRGEAEVQRDVELVAGHLSPEMRARALAILAWTVHRAGLDPGDMRARADGAARLRPCEDSA